MRLYLARHQTQIAYPSNACRATRAVRQKEKEMTEGRRRVGFSASFSYQIK